MTRIDFYVLESNDGLAQAQLSCRIANKAYDTQHQVYIHTDTAQQSEQLDRLMWTYPDGSFLPHCFYSAPESADTPVLIGHDHEPEQATEVLINLADEVPPFYSRFERIVELVTGDEATRQKARQRYKYYRDRGYAIETHTLSG